MCIDFLPRKQYHTDCKSLNTMFGIYGMKTQTAVFYAILAAVLYALLAPVSKLLQVSVPPTAEAGLLYLGAGAGMLFIYLFQRKKPSAHPSVGRNDLKYVIAMIILDMLAPVCLLFGLSMTTPENVSLLNNFEIVATTCIAGAFFHEKIGKRLALSISIITASCILLSLDNTASLSFSKGSVPVLLACVCWGFENNCTSSLSGKDTRRIVMIKGFGSGTASLLLSLMIGEDIRSVRSCIFVLILGFLAVGLSVYFYVLAQSRIGAARTSSYYAVSPFIGVLISLFLFREIPGKLFWAALALMAAGVYLNVKDTENV